MLFLEKLTLFPMAQLHKLCCTITVPLHKAYIETFTILSTSYTTHLYFNVGRIWLGRR
jgi:hypothetical protein